MSERTRSSETERRRATVVFADITGFSTLNEKLDPEEAYAIVTGCLKLLDGIARKHGGSVDKYLGDCIMAVFGVPFAMEDAPRAAVNAAIEMHRRVHEYNREHRLADPLDVHTGINTGLMISGEVSGPVVREFAVMGDAVNVAARLKDLAPKGRIWVGPETHRYTKDEFEYRVLDPIVVKGREQKVPIFEVLSTEEKLYRPPVRGAGFVTAPLVGRDAEIGRLRAIAGDTARGRGGIVGIVGEAGLGKSRLVEELLGAPEAQELVRLKARAVTVGAALSFHPFRDLFRQLFELEGLTDDRAAAGRVAERVEAWLPDEAADVAPFLIALMGLPQDPAARKRLHGIEGEALEKLTLRAVSQLLRARATERPLLIVFEDLHWADGSSVSLLGSLLPLSRDHAVRFCLVCRPRHPDSSDRLRELAREEHGERYEELALRPLDASSATRLIDSLFAGGDVPETTRDLVERKTAGNPFYIEEVVRSLVEEGALERRDGSLFATERIHAVQIPGSVQEVIMARVDRLESGPRAVLQVASVIGREVHRPVLADVAEDPELERHLDLLIDVQLLEEGGADRWQFRHPLLQEVTYGAILKATREALHRKVACSIEARLPETTPGYNGMLAMHFSLGRDLENAETYLLEAGREATRMAAPSEALRFFEEATRIYLEQQGDEADPRRLAALEAAVARARFNRGEHPHAAEHFTRALALLGVTTPQGAWATNLRFLRAVASVLGHLYLRRRTVKRPAATDEDREIFELLVDRSRSLTTSDPKRFLVDSLEYVRKLNQVDPKSVERPGGSYAGAIGIFSFGGLSFAVGRRFLEVARDVVDEDDPRDLVTFRMMSFFHHFLVGDWSDEHELSPALLDESLRAGVLWDVVNYYAIACEKHVLQGRYEQVETRLEELDKIAEAYQDDLARSTAARTRALLSLERRRLEPALAEARQYHDAHKESLLRILATEMDARARVFSGDAEGAQASLERCDALVARSGRVLPFYTGNVERTRLQLAVQRLGEAVDAGDAVRRRKAARDVSRVGRGALRVAARVAARQPEVLCLAATGAWLRGRRRAALAGWRRSADRALALGTRPELARTWAEVSRWLGTDAPDAGPFAGVSAGEAGARALAELEALGLAWDAARLSGAGSR